MRKKSILKKARYLSQAEETSCILDEQNGKTKENEDNSPSETSKLKTEIESFMDDTGNELRFYLEDNNITNDTEKCKKASSYINWRGMDYVNLLLSEKEKYNISCLVEKWNEKQKSFQTSIDEKMKSTCSTTTFDYCAILNKNDKCTRPYEYNDLPVPTSLTYAQLNDDSYSTNKTQIIEDRRLSFFNITNDMSNYHYRVYEKDRSERNCGKWSMYIYKRGKQFVNMAENELYENQLYINDSIRIWNDHSNTLQNIELRDTGIQCNMTTLIHQIKERQNTADPYNLDWLSSNSTQNESNETSNNTTTSPDNLKSTNVTPNVLHNDTTTGSLGSNRTSVNNVNDVNSFENTFTSATSIPSVTTDQTSPETKTTISPEHSTQSNSLTPSDTIDSNTNTISDATSSSVSPEIVISPTTKLLPLDSTISGTPTVTSYPEEISSTATTEYSITNVESFTNNIAPSTTITPPPITASLPSKTVSSEYKTFTDDNKSSTNKITPPTISPSSSEVIPSHSSITTTSIDEFTRSLLSPTPIVKSSINDYTTSISNTTDNSIDTEFPTNSITPSKTYEASAKTASLSPETTATVNEIISANVAASPTIDPVSSPGIEPSLTSMTTTPTDSSTPPLSSSTPIITTLPFTYNSASPTDYTERSTSIIDTTYSLTDIESSTSNTTNSAATSFFHEIAPSATSSISSKTISFINHDSPISDNASTINYAPINNPETSIFKPESSIPGVVNPTIITESFTDGSILPTTVDIHITATSPLTDSSTPFSTNNENTITTNELSTSRITSSTNGTTAPTSDFISPTPLSYSPDKTSILTTTTAYIPTTNNDLPSLQTDGIQLQIPPNTHAPLKQAQQYSYGRNSTENISLSPSATIPNILTPIPSSDPNEVMPTVTPKGDLLIPMVSGGIFLLGIIFFLILLCKYTPIGSWIRNRKSKKKKARKKIKKITREPLLMDTNNTKNESINRENYSFLHYEKEIPLCDMSLKNRKDLKYKQVKKSKAHKGMHMENEKDLKYKHVKKSKEHDGTYMENKEDLNYEQIKKSKEHKGIHMENEKDLMYEQMIKSKEHKGIYMENEKDLKYEQMKKSKAYEGMYMENENKCISEFEEVSKKHENEFILGEKLNEYNPRNEIEEIELNVNKSRNKIKEEKLNENRLGINTSHIVEYIMEDTLNEEETNEINIIQEKYECENEMINLENKRSINEVHSWNTWIDVHMIALQEYKKEEWKLNKAEFFKICLEEIQKDGKNYNLKDMGNNFIMKIKEENSTNTIDKKSSILMKYKNEKWFINLKKEWKEEQEKYLGYLEEQEIEKMTEMGVNNIILDKKKKIWKKWIEWQIEHSHKYKNQNWFIKLLEEYEKEDIHENIKEEKIENKGNNGIDECEMKKNLESRILLDIYMMVLEESTKEEWEKEEEFFKANMEEMKKYKNFDEQTNILDKIERERSWNVISEKKKEEIEKWKKEKWFVELMLEWKNKEEEYMMETNEEILAKKNQGRLIDVILERQSSIWKKHCENICKKWIDEDNNEEWFTKLVNEYENEEKEYKSSIYKNSIEKENEKSMERGESITEVNKKGDEKMRKYERNHLEESHENNNSIIGKKKLKWQTLIEIYMVILEECRKEEWLLNRGKFLEVCLEEFINEDKEEYSKITENDLAIMREGEEDISTLMIEKQKLLWKIWVERNKRMLEKWKNEEWFINLKNEWRKEQERYEELTDELEIVEIEAGKNPMLEKQKKIWKQWLKKQRMWFIEHSEEEWFNDLLDECEKEEEGMEGISKRDTRNVKEIHENIEGLKQEGNKEIMKYGKNEKLIQKVLIEIHMMLLEEYIKEEWQKEKEHFFKKMIEELRIQQNLGEDVNILEKKKKKSKNVILENQKVEIDRWKKKKWFIELMLEMKNKEKNYIKEIYEDMITKKNEDKIRNPMLERQKIIWKKHCEDIHNKWIEKNSKKFLQQ
ncbi:surface-associated interspersed protein (SURFIN) [Plasmodium gallinaceum]|uniref:Surface-associated interspersed protein (SURFIN) n=1 Tax=Plasmodium gallinaceum TaxID=5849 RepID=A0A1J1GSJ0_PLAGA|nr:surface-associated interspersed protein (SURFIN) [Plasmodium gallinaceum]CRG95493.1 surface-associated interspersed protein (SURFIN) [Plasmodium gallinaceum]